MQLVAVENWGNTLWHIFLNYAFLRTDGAWNKQKIMENVGLDLMQLTNEEFFKL